MGIFNGLDLTQGTGRNPVAVHFLDDDMNTTLLQQQGEGDEFHG